MITITLTTTIMSIIVITTIILYLIRSVGVVTYVLLTGLSPFLGDSNMET